MSDPRINVNHGLNINNQNVENVQNNQNIPQGLENPRVSHANGNHVGPARANNNIPQNAQDLVATGVNNNARGRRRAAEKKISSQDLSNLIAQSKTQEIPPRIASIIKNTLEGIFASYGKDLFNKVDIDLKNVVSSGDKFNALVQNIANIPDDCQADLLPALITDSLKDNIHKLFIVQTVSYLDTHGRINVSGSEGRKILSDKLQKNEEFMRDIEKCASKKQLEQVFTKHKVLIEKEAALVGSFVKYGAFAAQLSNEAAKVFEKQTGFSGKILANDIEFKAVFKKIGEVKNNLLNGAYDNTDPKEIESLCKKMLDDEIEKRLTFMTKIDNSDLNENLKNQLKYESLNTSLDENVSFEQLKAIGEQDGIRSFIKSSFQFQNFDHVRDLGTAFDNIESMFMNTFGAENYEKFSNEQKSLMFKIVLKSMLSKDPELAALLKTNIQVLKDFENSKKKFASVLTSSVQFSGNVNGDFANNLANGKYYTKTNPGYYLNGVLQGFEQLRESFGEHCLKAGISEILDQKLPGTNTKFGEKIAQEIRALDHNVTCDEIKDITSKVLIQTAKENATMNLIKKMSSDKVLTLNEEELNATFNLIKQEQPQFITGLNTVKDHNELEAYLNNSAEVMEIVNSKNSLKNAIENNRETKIESLVQSSGLYPAQLQTAIKASKIFENKIYTDYYALPPQDRPKAGTDAFNSFCENELSPLVASLDGAFTAIKNSQLPDAQKIRMVTAITKGELSPSFVLHALSSSKSSAESIDLGRINTEIGKSKISTSKLISKLTDLENTLNTIVPTRIGTVAVTEENRQLIKTLTRMTMLKNNGLNIIQEATKIKAESLRVLMNKAGNRPDVLNLLHEARSIYAENWLQPQEVDEILKGSDLEAVNTAFENVLTKGIPLFDKYKNMVAAPVQAMLKRFIGMMDLTKDNVESTVRSFVKDCTKCDNFDLDHTPPVISEKLTKHTTKYANTVAEDKNDTTSFDKDTGRSLYTFQGKNIVTNMEKSDHEFKLLLSAGKKTEDMSDEELQLFNKKLAFFRALMMQGSITDVMNLSMHDETLFDDGIDPLTRGGNETLKLFNFKNNCLSFNGATMQADLLISEDRKKATVSIKVPMLVKIVPPLAREMSSDLKPMAYITTVDYVKQTEVDLSGDFPKIISTKLSQKFSSNIRK